MPCAVNLLKQHIIVQDQDGQNNNILQLLSQPLVIFIDLYRLTCTSKYLLFHSNGQHFKLKGKPYVCPNCYLLLLLDQLSIEIPGSSKGPEWSVTAQRKTLFFVPATMLTSCTKRTVLKLGKPLHR